MLAPIKNAPCNFANSKFVKNHINKCMDNPAFLTKTLLVTSVSKDVFAYALRVKNAAQNKEIPQDKKEYMMKMDSITGVTTAIVQLGSGFLLANEKVQDKICSKLFSSIDKNSKLYKNASAGFGTISSLVGATLFAKRILVPLISSTIINNMAKKPENENLDKKV